MTPYETDGYVVLRQWLPAEWVESARVRAYAMHEEGRGNFGAYGVYDHPDGTHWHRRRVHDIYEVARLIACLPVGDLLGPGKCGITHSKFSYKRCGEQQVWAPHQDIAYKSEPRHGVVFAVPLEPVNVANGTLELVPGSHRLGPLPHRNVPTMTQQIELTEPVDGFVPVEAQPGDLVAFSLLTVHRSGPNTGAGLRAILFVEIEPWTDKLQDELGGPITTI